MIVLPSTINMNFYSEIEKASHRMVYVFAICVCKNVILLKICKEYWISIKKTIKAEKNFKNGKSVE